MKLIRIISLACVVLFAVCACQQEEYGPSSFALQEDVYGDIPFEYGQTRQLGVTMANIKVLYVKCSEGWSGKIENEVLSITAPVAEKAVSGFGEIGLYARGYDDVEWIVKLGVEVREDVKEGEPQSWTATRESNALVDALWKPEVSVRGYDAADTDGYNIESAMTVPEEGVAELTLNGVVSAGATQIYAVTPAQQNVSCSALGVLSGLELSGQQKASDNVPALMVAKGAEGKMEFKNIFSYLTATFEDGMITKLVIEDTDGECALAGTFSYDINSLAAAFSQKSSSLTLLPAEDQDVFAAGTYSFACMPESMSGMKITAYTSTGKAIVKNVNETVTLGRNAVYDLGTFKNELQPLDKTGWKMLYCNSELLENFSGQSYVGSDGDSYTGAADDMIDGDYASFWSYHYRGNGTQRADAVDYLPYYIVIDLGKEVTLNSMALTARQPGGTGAMATYNETYTSQVARMTIEFANSLTMRGMGDVLNKTSKCWLDAETYDENVLKNQKVNKVDFSKSHTARYVRLTIREGYKNNSETTPTYVGGTLAEFDLYTSKGAADADKISKTGWSIVYAKSERLENYGGHGFASYGGFTGAARHLIDDNYLSIWSYHANPAHASAIPTVQRLPYHFVIDFGKEIEISAFRLTNKWAKNNFADQNSFASGPGGVKFEFSNSISGRGMDDVLENGKYISSEWTVYNESFDHTKIRKQKSMTVPFAQPVKARYCRFTITKVYKDSDADGSAPTGGYGTSLAELDFLQ